jgi:hypothetical protein
MWLLLNVLGWKWLLLCCIWLVLDVLCGKWLLFCGGWNGIWVDVDVDAKFDVSFGVWLTHVDVDAALDVFFFPFFFGCPGGAWWSHTIFPVYDASTILWSEMGWRLKWVNLRWIVGSWWAKAFNRKLWLSVCTICLVIELPSCRLRLMHVDVWASHFPSKQLCCILIQHLID